MESEEKACYRVLADLVVIIPVIPDARNASNKRQDIPVEGHSLKLVVDYG